MEPPGPTVVDKRDIAAGISIHGPTADIQVPPIIRRKQRRLRQWDAPRRIQRIYRSALPNSKPAIVASNIRELTRLHKTRNEGTNISASAESVEVREDIRKAYASKGQRLYRIKATGTG